MAVVTVAKALEAELKAMGAAASGSVLAAAARRLALHIDAAAEDATKLAAAVKELRATMAELREIAPPPTAKDKGDELKERRARNAAAAAGRALPN